MTKKHFIALADAIREHNRVIVNVWGANGGRMSFSDEELHALAHFCQSQNPRFDRERWLGYIAGTCGPNGGTIKRERED